MKSREDILEFIEDKNVFRRILYWGFLAGLFAFFAFGPIKLTSVNGKSMGPDLRPYEYYASFSPNKICIGDFIKFKSTDDSQTLVRSVIALGGSKFELSDNGFQIDGQPFAMSARWVQAAREKHAAYSQEKIPENQLLLMRTLPDLVPDDQFEAYLIVDSDNIDGHLSRVFITANPLRIGKSLRQKSVKCVVASSQ